MTPGFEARIGEYLDVFEAFATEMSPRALDFALTVVRWEAAGWLLFGFILTSFAVLSFTVSYHSWKAKNDDESFGLFLVGLFVALFGLPLFLYPWNWIAVFNPEWALARRLFGMIGGG